MRLPRWSMGNTSSRGASGLDCNVRNLRGHRADGRERGDHVQVGVAVVACLVAGDEQCAHAAHGDRERDPFLIDRCRACVEQPRVPAHYPADDEARARGVASVLAVERAAEPSVASVEGKTPASPKVGVEPPASA